MNKCNCLSVIVVFLCLFPIIAFGHSPYEKIERILETEKGEKIKLVRLYWDGIIDLDPVQIVAYDENAYPFFETGTGRDVFVYCKKGGGCFMFLFKGFFSVVPEEKYKIKDQEVTEVDDFWMKFCVLFTPIQRIKSYLVTMLFLFISFLLWFYGIRLMKKRKILANALLFLGLFSLFWVACVVDVSRVLFLPLAVIVGIIVFIYFFCRKIFFIAKNNVHNKAGSS